MTNYTNIANVINARGYVQDQTDGGAVDADEVRGHTEDYDGLNITESEQQEWLQGATDQVVAEWAETSIIDARRYAEQERVEIESLDVDLRRKAKDLLAQRDGGGAMKLTIKHAAQAVRPSDGTICGIVPVGATVQYRGHVVGGMLLVEYEGMEVIIHPAATNELS